MPPRKRRNVRKRNSKATTEAKVESNKSRITHQALRVPLPLDVLLLILDAVSKLDEPYHAARKTLCSCALTCRTLRRPAQVRMYADVSIWKQYEFEAFGRTLLDNPELALMVKKLYANVGSAWHAVWVLPKDELPLSAKAVAGMTNLQKLSIGGLHFHERTEVCSAVLENFIGSFAASCPKIEFLRIDHMEFREYTNFVHHVTAFSGVKTLELSCVKWRGRG
ncbi:hypothetical protein L226DRAFT_612044 [Lentinus tigrinus ALCF2SS1-7]|uniref:F-box domain-containing protein n=1 Tax=Lentinus tigrinus ALCF2SS1-6 TaxID=1328759 RepID=A0A5C2S9D7_9APHY|nr:hypothetical protein L227DRAFT_600736 [Lentinus tigrinus ALCF2SS1-6]RPD75718.1 hypothetical protein L226DRAFT_612044 [Lentinus tigrinus ALCF2SS1-7]